MSLRIALIEPTQREAADEWYTDPTPTMSPKSTGLPPGPDAGLDATTRVQHRQWLDTWKRVGPILEAARWEQLAVMTEAEAQQASQLVLELWQPDWHGDDGAELLLHQRVFARARR